ncbi:MAG: Asp23/Gls24 family envelope stress response protein [Ruminococcus sp.]|nr:Asp23/Gls24 family envelope stress response protein [Ruminococcus sp.]
MPCGLRLSGIEGFFMIVTENYMGRIIMSERLIKSICGRVLSKTFGVSGLCTAGRKWSLASIASPRDFTDERNAANAITIKYLDGGLVIGVHIFVLYGTKVSAVSDSVMNKLRFELEEKTGLKIKRITVYVDGVTD